MNEMSQNELVQRERAKDMEEIIITLKNMPDEPLIDEFINRYKFYKEHYEAQVNLSRGAYGFPKL